MPTTDTLRDANELRQEALTRLSLVASRGAFPACLVEILKGAIDCLNLAQGGHYLASASEEGIFPVFTAQTGNLNLPAVDWYRYIDALEHSNWKVCCSFIGDLWRIRVKSLNDPIAHPAGVGSLFLGPELLEYGTFYTSLYNVAPLELMFVMAILCPEMFRNKLCKPFLLTQTSDLWVRFTSDEIHLVEGVRSTTESIWLLVLKKT